MNTEERRAARQVIRPRVEMIMDSLVEIGASQEEAKDMIRWVSYQYVEPSKRKRQDLVT